MSVKISYDRLGSLAKELGAIVEEFEKAGSRRNDLKKDVGKPYDDGRLRDVADDFEGRWDDRRHALIDNCKTLKEHVEAVIEGFQQFDRDAAEKFDEKEES